jgi:muramoyltetrapeptide carboxypeptidase
MPGPVVMWCPAYPLPPTHRQPALTAAADFAEALGASLETLDDLDGWTGEGAWPAAEQRQATFRNALRGSLLVAARGGYGCLDLLDEVAAHQGPLPGLVGYSDLTVLHAAWSVRGGPETCYGFMPGVPHGPRASATAVNLCRGLGHIWNPTLVPDVQPIHPGNARGPLFAGCLRVLVGLVGTRFMPDLRGRLLAIEDIDERPYRIDRDLHQLQLAGQLSGITGLITNAFPCALPERYQGPTASEIIRGWAQRLGIPAIVGLPFGHHADPLALPCGRSATLQVTSSDWSLVIAPR